MIRFNNGGILFSSVFLVAIAAISLFSFLLLVESRQVVPASFGDIGGHLYGPAMRLSVLFAIAISQIGFVCAYMSFVATNLEALARNVLDASEMYPSYFFVLVQLIVFIPLALVITPLLSLFFIFYFLFFIFYLPVPFRLNCCNTAFIQPIINSLLFVASHLIRSATLLAFPSRPSLLMFSFASVSSTCTTLMYVSLFIITKACQLTLAWFDHCLTPPIFPFLLFRSLPWPPMDLVTLSCSTPKTLLYLSELLVWDRDCFCRNTHDQMTMVMMILLTFALLT
jgi:hypothetical protein